MIQELTKRLPQNPHLKLMNEKTKDGYKRSSANALLELARQVSVANRRSGESRKLIRLLVETLEVESDREH